MAAERTYLELSEDDGVSHKFYEVIVDGKDLTIRYGRIGTDGQTQQKSFPSPDKARAEAQKKIGEKTRKGYAPAVQGVRKKRAITRRAIQSTPSTARRAPVLWRYDTGRAAFGVFVDARGCWVGNEDGRVFALDHDGKLVREFRLPDGVKCLVSDGDWLYAGCDDGNVYDLTGKVPVKAYEIAENVDIFWLDIADAVLGVSDQQGNVHVFNHEDETQWTKKSSGEYGWMVRCDEIGVYHGHSRGVTMYDWEDGSRLWHQDTSGAVLFGWQEESTLYAGTSSGLVYRFSKRGDALGTLKCDAAVFSCAAAEDGRFVFAGDNCSSIYCFGADGKRLWKFGSNFGSAFSMQFFQDRLYLVTTTGALVCIDASEAAIQAAEAGQVPVMRDLKAPAASAATPAAGAIETTRDASGGVVVVCVSEGGRLRVRVQSPGYNSDWNVQFPRDLRAPGARFVVESVREADRGGFYRVFGEIRRLV